MRKIHWASSHLRPSTMITWYPKFVLTKGDKMGLSTVDGVRANAASWNAPFMTDKFRLSESVNDKLLTTMDPRTIQPRLPPAGTRIL